MTPSSEGSGPGHEQSTLGTAVEEMAKNTFSNAALRKGRNCGASDRPKVIWYGVTATYKAAHPGQRRRRHLWERITFLIRAENDASAEIAARRVAEEKEHEYTTASGDMVRWVVQEIESVQSILDDDIDEGTEVSWQFYERVDKMP